MRRRIALIFVSLFTVAMLGGCADDFCGQTTFNDSYYYKDAIAALNQAGVAYREIGEQTISYGCAEEAAVREVLDSVVASRLSSCGGMFHDPGRQSDFTARLDSAGIAYRLVRSDEGEMVVCDPNDREGVSELFQQSLRWRNAL